MKKLPKRPTEYARLDRDHWLKQCIGLGWRSDQLVDLERLWWKYHDNNGDLVMGDPRTEAEIDAVMAGKDTP